MIVRFLASLGPIGVGLLFLFTSAIKLVGPFRFHQHLSRIGVRGPMQRTVLAPSIATGEAIAGAALIVGLAPSVVAPAVGGVLAALSGVTVWSTTTRRTEDCGCYGGLVEVPPAVSVLLNLGYAALVILGWRVGRPLMRRSGHQIIVIGAVGVTAAIVGALGEWRLRTARKPLIDLRPMRPGKRWNARWLPNKSDAFADGEHILAFLGEHCATCKRWASPLSKMHARPDLPPILGIMPISDEAVAAYVKEHGITFPVVPMRRETHARLVDAVPTIAVVRDGFVRSVDHGVLPPDLIERVKRRPTTAPGLLAMVASGLHENSAASHNHALIG